MDEAGAVHRLERRPDRLPVAPKPIREAAQPITIGRRRADLDRLPTLVEEMKVEASAAEIQTGVQH
jgi:hypothetical protein